MQTGLSGVYYRKQDHIGIVRRLLIDAVDIPVAVALSALVMGATRLMAPEAAELPGVLFVLCVALWFGYFVILKRSRFRTAGYVIGGAQIVDLKGGRPGIGSLLARLLFALAGPFNFVIDLFWMTADPSRQALRDKFANTYVIKKGATPAGTGDIVLSTYTVAGSTFLFREVKRPREER